MIDGIKEKMAQLLDDIEKEVGKDSKLYVHAYDVYADIVLYKSLVRLSDAEDLLSKEAQNGM